VLVGGVSEGGDPAPDPKTAAIAAGRGWLLSRHEVAGGFETAYGSVGASALCYVAVAPALSQDERRRAARWLSSARSLHNYDHAVGAWAMALLGEGHASGGGPALASAERSVRRLASSRATGGGWGYRSSSDSPDLINTFLVILGLDRVAALRGGVQEPRVLESIDPHWMATRGFLGRLLVAETSVGRRGASGRGVRYRNGSTLRDDEVTGTHAATAIYCLRACLERVSVDRRPAIEEDIRACSEWLTTHYSVGEDPGSNDRRRWIFYLFTLKSAMRALERTRIGEHDWKAEGEAALIASQRKDGSWGRDAVQTALALLFLEEAERTGPVAPRPTSPRGR
jgi:hypothetical protein